LAYFSWSKPGEELKFGVKIQYADPPVMLKVL